MSSLEAACLVKPDTSSPQMIWQPLNRHRRRQVSAVTDLLDITDINEKCNNLKKIRIGMFAQDTSFRVAAILSLFLALASPSYAIDFSVVITDLKNDPLTERSADGRVNPITLGQLCSNALLATYEDERSLPAQEKIKRFKLALKLNDANGNPAKDVSLTTAEIAEIGKLTAKLYSPLAVGKILQIIDPGALK